ncbi:MAG: hypothetical protein IKA01_04055 [Alistipes sp.]|nr:hypothetical protein [Alistipes sp.]
MKKKTEKTSVSYDPVVISETTNVQFTKSVKSTGTAIYGKILKDGAEVGQVSYEETGDYMITSVKPFSKLTKEEVAELYAQVPTCIDEMLHE